MQIRSNCDGHFGFRWSKMYLKTVELLFNWSLKTVPAHRIPGDFFVEPSVNQAGHKVGQKMRNLSRCSYTVHYSLGAQPLVQRLVLVRR